MFISFIIINSAESWLIKMLHIPNNYNSTLSFNSGNIIFCVWMKHVKFVGHWAQARNLRFSDRFPLNTCFQYTVMCPYRLEPLSMGYRFLFNAHPHQPMQPWYFPNGSTLSVITDTFPIASVYRLYRHRTLDWKDVTSFATLKFFYPCNFYSI